MDLSKFVVDEPPPPRHSRYVWEKRFEALIAQGLTGQWINATEAWGLEPTNQANAKRAADRCGVTMEARIHDGRLLVCVK